jgi:dephospho-CoA kinase
VIPFIGLTGGIGAGKSTALDALQRLGAACLSTDRVVHDLYGSAEVREAVVARFGSDVARDGTIDRDRLARTAFGVDGGREWLEQLLWPRVGTRVAAWRREIEDAAPPPRAAVVEVPLLFEAEMESGFDATIAVIADEQTRRSRAAARGHQALDERTARQLSQNEKSERATFTVVNDGSVGELEQKLSAILDMIHK